MFDAVYPGSLKMPVAIAVGTQILDVGATSPDGNGPVSFRMVAVGGDVAAINTTTGVVTITAAPTVAGVVSLTISAVDNRTVCPSTSGQGVVTVASGGCTTSVTVKLEFISFVSCPNDVDQYLDPSKTSAVVSWTRPVLPAIYSSVAVTSSLGAWQSSYSFNVGVHTVTYSTAALDFGGAVACVFKVRIQYGFTVNVTDIGHVATSTNTLDFMIDDAGVSNGGAQIPAFIGDVLGQGLSIGVLSPPKKPFSLFLRPNFSAKLLIYLHWCETGTFPTSPTNFQSMPAKVCLDCVRAHL